MRANYKHRAVKLLVIGAFMAILYFCKDTYYRHIFGVVVHYKNGEKEPLSTIVI